MGDKFGELGRTIEFLRIITESLNTPFSLIKLYTETG